MKTRLFRLLALPTAILLLLVAASAGASPQMDSTDTGESATYIIQLSSPPAASYRGGVAGLAATNPEVRGEVKLDSKSQATLAYVSHLEQEQAQFVSAAELQLGRPITVKYQYQHAFNGVAIVITAEEAAIIGNMAGVTLVQRETIEVPLTDAGPAFIGAPGIWDGTDTGGLPGTMGEGVIVGVIDTGINSDNPSFADVGGDGYNHTNPFGSGNYVGHCVSTPSFCNDKLIGAWNYTDGPEDSDGHGSHTSSTAAGNVLMTVDLEAPTITFTADQISGVAPHANIIMYDACLATCPGAGLLAAVNQAVTDGVDVINYSISGGTTPYTDAVELAFLAARDAGVFVATSAGNSGPGPTTVAHRSPWLTTVAASTHNRAFLASLVDMTGGNTTPPADLHGRSISEGYGPATIVYAGAPPYNNPLCNPFPGGTFSGEIVVCDRGTIGRVEKGQNVLNAGGGGYVLADSVATADIGGLSADPHVLPAVHIPYAEGVTLKAWLASGSNHMGTITESTMDFDIAHSDVMASFSSRGPNVALADIIKPDVAAPGVDIFAAYKNGEEHWVISGTSMASPHTAGAGALLRALHPDWSAAEIQSALMTTAYTAMTKEDAATPADPYDMGAGRIDLSQAGMAGIVLHETLANYQAANPGTGGNPFTLNLPSMAQDNCITTCSWTRVISSTQDSSVTWTASTSAPAGMTVSVEPSSFALAAYASRTITVTANVAGLDNGVWTFGEVTLTPNVNPPVEAHFPVAVMANNPAGPAIDVDPDALSSTQEPNTVVTETLTINNLGTGDLDWTIYENNTTGSLAGGWSDNFDSYETGSNIHGQGGWKGWFNDPNAAAIVTDDQAVSDPNSVEIVGSSDLVHEFTGYTSGQWTLTTMLYVPSDFSGETYFILLNTYDDTGATNNWSVQVNLSSAGTVTNEGVTGGVLDLVTGEWVEIRVDIDLDNDTQDFYYDGQLLYSGTWTDEVSGGGALTFDTIDLYANGASAVYYDDFVLAPTPPAGCGGGDIPWLTVDPTSGSTPGGGSDDVAVGFDSTGLEKGTYTAELCVASNDPGAPVVNVPVTLNVDIVPTIDLVKTVGTDGDSCATEDAITVEAGTDVTYCYEVTNTGTLTLTTHDLDDSELGAILTDFDYDLGPGASVYVTETTTIQATTVNTATWTAYGDGSNVATATASATVTVEDSDFELYLPVIVSNSAGAAATPAAGGPEAGWLALTLPFLIVGGMGFGWQRRRKLG
jgi:hypothetical protein